MTAISRLVFSAVLAVAVVWSLAVTTPEPDDAEPTTATSHPVCGRHEPTLTSAPSAEPEPLSSSTRYSFVDVSQQRGLVLEHCRSWGSTWTDHDLDGDPDLLINRHHFRPFFYDNAGGSYRRASWDPTLRVRGFDRHNCLWGDPSHDGLPDILCTQGAEKGRGTGPNQLLIQQDDGTFADMTYIYGVEYEPGRGRVLNWVDYDRDGDLDLFIGAQRRPGYPNRMYRNDRGRFNWARVGLEQEIQTEGTAWGDWDRDGDLDVVLTLKNGRTRAYENRGGRFRRAWIPRVTSADWHSASFGNFNRDRWPDLLLVSEGRTVVLRNKRGRFVRAYRTKTLHGRMGVWFDADNDGDQDIFIVRGAAGKGDNPNAVDQADLLLVRVPGGFRKRAVRSTGASTGNGDSVAVADHDRNGSLDLFVTNGYKRAKGPFILAENRSRTRKWAGLRLDGGKGDPYGMWARVRVKAGKRVYWRHLTDGVFFRAQSEVGYTHLGLRGADRAKVRVVWPKGPPDCLRVQAGTITTLQKGTASCG